MWRDVVDLIKSHARSHARAYMRSAEMLILNEPKVALDARFEFEVFQKFKELSKGKTTLYFEHLI